MSAVRTYTPRASEIEHDWYVVDAEGLTLGRLSTEVARVLRGKHKPTFTPNLDTGDHVIIVNAAKVRLTGKKLDQKKYYHHTGYTGGIREVNYRTLLATKPEFAVYEAIRRMMPKGPLGDKMLTKVRIYAGPEHKNAAQMPQPLTLK